MQPEGNWRFNAIQPCGTVIGLENARPGEKGPARKMNVEMVVSGAKYVQQRNATCSLKSENQL